MNLLDSSGGKKVLFTALYFSEGAPVGYIWWALPTLLRSGGVPVGEITSLTSLLIVPWILKAFWAPLVDLVQNRRWTLREWIYSTQALMGLSLLPVAFLDFAADIPTIGACLLVHAVAASLQDAAIDALAISTTGESERGSLNGWMQTGYLAGRSVFGGMLLIVSARFGGSAIVIPLIVTIWGIASLLLFLTKVPPRTGPPEAAGVRWSRYRLHLLHAARDRRVWSGFAFALIAGAAFEGVGAVGGPYLLDRGLGQAGVGWFFAVPAVAGMICGSLAGGYLVDRGGTLRVVGSSLIGIVLVVFGLAATETPAAPAGLEWTVAMFALLYLGIGLFTASSYAMFMNLTDARLGATQFSAFMGATNACESWSGYAAGGMIGAAGYGTAFATLAGISLLGLPALFRLHGDRPRE